MQETALNWPEWAERTPPEDRQKPRKFDKDYQTTKSELKSLFGNMGVEKWYIDEVTGSHADPGVIIRWTENGTDHAIACDHYSEKTGNLRESFLWLKFERRQGNRPIETGQDQFAAAQLPSAGEDVVVAESAAHDILDVPRDADQSTIREAYQERVKETHPDNGGSQRAFQRVQDAKAALIED